MPLMCATCGLKPAVVTSPDAVRRVLCWKCGTEPHQAAQNRASKKRGILKRSALQTDHGNKGKGKQ